MRAFVAAALILAVQAPAPAPAQDNVSAPAAVPAPLPSDAEPAASGAVIGEIRVRPENIFDVSDPAEDNRLFRLANRLHVRTRPRVIADQLLFRSGDRYDRRLLEESERILRSNRYLYDARIRPVAVRDGRVDVEVVTRDVWTLRPGFSFERKGGRNTTSLDLEETNLLGRGSVLGIASSRTPDRDTESVHFADEHLFGTWVRTDIAAAHSSDGKKRSWLLERPFYALDARWAAGASFLEDERIASLSGSGAVAPRFEAKTRFGRLSGGWSRGLSGGWTRRFLFGAVRDESRFAPPPGGTAGAPVPAHRVLAYPYLGFEAIEDDFDKAKNRDQIERTEDFLLGWCLRATLGYATPRFGADRRALPFSASAGKGARPGDRWTLLGDAGADGRVERGAVRDGTVSAAGRSYLRLSRRWLFFVSAAGSRLVRPDEDRELPLGGGNGLRGYPLDYQAGDRRFLVTLEQRYYSGLYPFRLFRLGGAVFFDAGRAWGGKRSGLPAAGVLRDAGFGLRVGNARSGLGNVIHVDVAFPFDGDPSIARAQLLVVTKQTF